MKKFFIRLGIFAMLVMACDYAVGIIGDKLVENANDGDTRRTNYIASLTDEDVLIFGSSRAYHHYDSYILEDTLGLSVYNCGFDATGIVSAYGFFKLITKRYYPKIVVYDATPAFDLNSFRDNHEFIGLLRYFYGTRGGNSVDSIFWKVDKTEYYKMFSNMYRYYSMLPKIIMHNSHSTHDDNKGYNPVDVDLTSEPKPLGGFESYEYDSLKLYYLEKLIKDCEGKTQLIFTISPLYEKTDDNAYGPLKALCDKYDVPLINHHTDSTFNFNRDYFCDRVHLNRTGATAFSKVIAGEIKQIINGK